MDEQREQGQQSEQGQSGSGWIGAPPGSAAAEGQVAPPAHPVDPAPQPAEPQEQEPLPGDEPVAEEDFADPAAAREHDEMDDGEKDDRQSVHQERVEEAAQAHEERHAGEQDESRNDQSPGDAA